jgi:hypothetical protein
MLILLISRLILLISKLILLISRLILLISYLPIGLLRKTLIVNSIKSKSIG